MMDEMQQSVDSSQIIAAPDDTLDEQSQKDMGIKVSVAPATISSDFFERCKTWKEQRELRLNEAR
jgi:hypothetical protein